MIKRGLFFSFVLFWAACTCVPYPRIDPTDETATFSISDHVRTTICHKEDIMIGFLERPPYNDSSYMDTYTLPNGKDTVGCIARISSCTPKNGKIPRLFVGTGSEFWIEKCKFRVVKVSPYITKGGYGEYITLKLLNCPKQFCDCRRQ